MESSLRNIDHSRWLRQHIFATYRNSVKLAVIRKTPATFLFSVTKIPDQQWAKVKSQMPDAQLIAHKNESIYFVQRTNKETVKGANSATYAQVYPLLDQLIQSIQVIE